MLPNLKTDKKLHLFADACEAAQRRQATPPLEALAHPLTQHPDEESFIPKRLQRGEWRDVWCSYSSGIFLSWNWRSYCWSLEHLHNDVGKRYDCAMILRIRGAKINGKNGDWEKFLLDKWRIPAHGEVICNVYNERTKNILSTQGNRKHQGYTRLQNLYRFLSTT